MSNSGFDELATNLREIAQRFGDTAFTDRRRLISLLSDRLPEARRDIKVVAAAVDERVFASLAQCRPEQLPMELERLAANLENGLGIRSDVAFPVVQACAYALALGPLPSQAGPGGGAPLPPAPAARSGDAWVGLSEPARTGWVGLSEPAVAAPPAPPPAAAPAATAAPVAAAKPRAWLRVVFGVAGALVLGSLALSQFVTVHHDTEDEPAPQPPPAVQPAPVVQPPPVAQPQPRPVAGPTTPQPAPEPAPLPTQPVFFGNEDVDFGIPPQSVLKAEVGNPTPMTLPGAQTVTTMQVASEMRAHHRMVLIDSLADQHPTTIMGAAYLPTAGQYGNFSDQVQSRLAGDLNALTHGQRELPLVFFCQGVRCWESYNAALRAHAAGYPHVYWYRGGLFSWEQAGLPTQPLQR